MVDGASRPRRIVDGGRLGVADRLERPEGPLLGSDTKAACPARGPRSRIRPTGAVLNPHCKIVHFFSAELALWGHRKLGVIMTNCLEQQALLGITWHNRRPAAAAFDHPLPRIQAQAAEFRLGVAREAVLRQNGPHTQFEELVLGGGVSC